MRKQHLLVAVYCNLLAASYTWADSPQNEQIAKVLEKTTRGQSTYITTAYLGFGHEPQASKVLGDLISNGPIRCSLSVEVLNERTYDLKASCTVSDKGETKIGFSQECEKGLNGSQDFTNIVQVETLNNFQVIILECMSSVH